MSIPWVEMRAMNAFVKYKNIIKIWKGFNVKLQATEKKKINIKEFDQDMVCVSLHYIGIRNLANFKQFNISSLVLSLLEQRKTSLAWALIGRNSSRTFIEQLWKVKLGLRAGFHKIVVVWYTVNLQSVCLMERRISH